MNMIKVVYITNPNKEEAERIATHLLEKNLIACANIFPINSLYWWQGSLKNSEECVVIAKTVESHYELIKKEVELIHSYSTPCVVGFSCSANESFFSFVNNAVKSDSN